MEQPPRPANEQIMPLRLGDRGWLALALYGRRDAGVMAYVAGSQGRSPGALDGPDRLLAGEPSSSPWRPTTTLARCSARTTIENTKLMQMSGLSLLATFIVVQFNFMQRIFDTTALERESVARLHRARLDRAVGDGDHEDLPPPRRRPRGSDHHTASARRCERGITRIVGTTKRALA